MRRQGCSLEEMEEFTNAYEKSQTMQKFDETEGES